MSLCRCGCGAEGRPKYATRICVINARTPAQRLEDRRKARAAQAEHWRQDLLDCVKGLSLEGAVLKAYRIGRNAAYRNRQAREARA